MQSKEAADEARDAKLELATFEEASSAIVLEADPNLVGRYLKAARSLRAELARGAKAEHPAMLVLREIIERVVARSSNGRGQSGWDVPAGRATSSADRRISNP